MSEVEALINRFVARFPGESRQSLNRYFEAVHQELAPLAREMEAERDRLRIQLAAPQPDTVTEQSWERIASNTLRDLATISELLGLPEDEADIIGFLRDRQPDTLAVKREWTPCVERLPTEADYDDTGHVWISFPDNESDMEFADVIDVERMAEKWPDTYWMPTGLVKPEPARPPLDQQDDRGKA